MKQLENTDYLYIEFVTRVGLSANIKLFKFIQKLVILDDLELRCTTEIIIKHNCNVLNDHNNSDFCSK